MKKTIFLLFLAVCSVVIGQNNLTVAGTASLTIADEGGVYVSGDFINSGTTSMSSKTDAYGALIVKGDIPTGNNIVYNRYVNTVGSEEWDLVGAPLKNVSISSFINNNTGAIASASNGGDIHYALGTYDHINDQWTNYTSATVGSAGNFVMGVGYQMASANGNTLAFQGAVALADQTQSIINERGDPVISPRGRWNLISNPYPSYLKCNINADVSNNFLSVNSGVIDPSFLSIYGWKADGSGYEIYNQASDAVYMAPGQGFWVAAESDVAANVIFTEDMQTLSGGDDFVLGRLANNSSEFYLKLYEAENLKAKTKFYFNNGLNLGLDSGYDAGAFNQSMALLSRLPEDDQGIGMSINAMSLEVFDTSTTIPLIINQLAGVPFKISLEDSSIPAEVPVYFYDSQTQIYTDLRAEDFRLTPANDLSGVGRFYLNITNTALGNDSAVDLYINIYKPLQQSEIVIEGLTTVSDAMVRLYNIVGQEVLVKNLKSNRGVQTLNTKGLSTGIYVVKLQAGHKLVTKKIIIN
jgi:hypothetical protein